MTRTHNRLPIALVALAALAACARPEVNAGRTAAPPARTLRVCADPNNLPFSNARREGFENRIAELIARDLGARVAYTWWPQHRGFVRMTLRRGDCDVIMGVPANFELAQTTAPYYRSSYTFVSRRDRKLGITSLDDPRLRALRIGVQLAGDDGSPPVLALAARKLTSNMRGYVVTGDYNDPDPPRRIVDAVARGEVDIAIVWGPQAGFFARRQPVPLDVVPLSPQIDPPFLPFVFDISMGVRRGDTAMRETLERELERRHTEIERILDDYAVPRV